MTSCTNKAQDGEFASSWEKKRWVSKLSRTLRYRQGLTPKDPADLADRSDEEIVAYFMDDPAFGSAVLDFHLYFLGIKPDHIRNPQTGIFDDETVTQYPQAVAATHGVLKNDASLSLFKYKQPLYMTPLTSPPQKKEGEDDETARLRAHQTILDAMDELKALAEADPFDRKAFCEKARTASQLPFTLGLPVFLAIGFQTSMDWFVPIQAGCSADLSYPFPADLPGAVARIKRQFESQFEAMKEFLPSAYSPRQVMEIKAGDSAKMFLNHTSFNFLFWQNKPNSSTNFNRKRGAEILKTYLCDDLAPIDIVIPGDSGSHKHGDDKGCVSCHYKLDPMAGFFRDIGLLGISFSGYPIILFDDQATADLKTYQENWKAPAGSGRVWETGIVRSLQFPAKNEYGESFEDLFKLIEKAPEAQDCYVKRLTEYFVGKDQIVDRGYLAYLTREYLKDKASGPGYAFKRLVTRIATSKTFREPDPEPENCYDYAPGTDPKSLPPCTVSYVLQKNCVGCHSGAGASAGLDLTRWIDLAGGEKGFPHIDRDGKQRLRKETTDSLLERLVSTDPKKRMPLSKYMTAKDTETLLLWLNAGGK